MMNHLCTYSRSLLSACSLSLSGGTLFATADSVWLTQWHITFQHLPFYGLKWSCPCGWLRGCVGACVWVSVQICRLTRLMAGLKNPRGASHDIRLPMTYCTSALSTGMTVLTRRMDEAVRDTHPSTSLTLSLHYKQSCFYWAQVQRTYCLAKWIKGTIGECG